MVESSFKPNTAANRICKSQALKVVFEYFDQDDKIRMQALNKRFYNTFCPAIVDRVQLYNIGNMSVGLFVSPQEDFVNLLIPDKTENSLCAWKKKKFEMAPETNMAELLQHTLQPTD
jgi:hypothetical protein